MTVGEIIKQYRKEHGLSQRDFADICSEVSDGKVTYGYISMVENGRNPTTKKPVVPSIDKMALFARGMGMSLHHLISIADDMPVYVGESDYGFEEEKQDITPEPRNRRWKMLSSGSMTLTDDQLDKLYDMAHVMFPQNFPERNDDDDK